MFSLPPSVPAACLVWPTDPLTATAWPVRGLELETWHNSVAEEDRWKEKIGGWQVTCIWITRATARGGVGLRGEGQRSTPHIPVSHTDHSLTDTQTKETGSGVLGAQTPAVIPSTRKESEEEWMNSLISTHTYAWTHTHRQMHFANTRARMGHSWRTKTFGHIFYLNTHIHKLTCHMSNHTLHISMNILSRLNSNANIFARCCDLNFTLWSINNGKWNYDQATNTSDTTRNLLSIYHFQFLSYFPEDIRWCPWVQKKSLL